MSEKYGPFGLSYEDEEKRLHNLELAQKYLGISGPSRNYERAKFSTDDGTMILTFALGDGQEGQQRALVSVINSSASFIRLGLPASTAGPNGA